MKKIARAELTAVNMACGYDGVRVDDPRLANISFSRRPGNEHGNEPTRHLCAGIYLALAGRWCVQASTLRLRLVYFADF